MDEIIISGGILHTREIIKVDRITTIHINIITLTTIMAETDIQTTVQTTADHRGILHLALFIEITVHTKIQIMAIPHNGIQHHRLLMVHALLMVNEVLIIPLIIHNVFLTILGNQLRIRQLRQPLQRDPQEDHTILEQDHIHGRLVHL